MNDNIQAGLILAQRAAPYLRYAFAAIEIIETSAVPIGASDEHWRVYINPAYPLTAANMAWLLLHEVGGHLVRGHCSACSSHQEDAERINLAQDLEIESWEWDGADRIAAGAHPSALGLPVGETWQWYLERLPHSTQSAMDCGSGAHGRSRPWEQGARADVNKPLIRAAQQAAAKAISAQAPGTVPLGLAVWAKSILSPPPVDWRSQLRCELSARLAAGLGDMIGPARERRGVLEPRWRKPQPRIAIIADTSGSMESEGGVVLGACVDIIRIAGACDVCWADVEPVWQRSVRSRRELAPRGGGGTDLRPAILAARHGRYDCTVVISDGYTPWPATAAHNEIVFITSGGTAPPPHWRSIQCQ